MRIVNINGNEVKFFDSPEDLPMKRYHRFNKFLTKDSEIGSDFADFNTRSIKAIEFLKKDMKDEAINELDNRRIMVYNAFMEYSPHGQALAILVHSINGVIKDDISSDGLEKTINELSDVGITQKMAKETTSEVKKNWIRFLKFISRMSLRVTRFWNIIPS